MAQQSKYLTNKAKQFLQAAGKIMLIEITCEALIMYVILPPLQPHISNFAVNLLDPLLLVLMTTPLIARFVIKPYVIAQHELIEQLNLNSEKLIQSATQDSLTGLYNRTILNEKLHDIITNMKKETYYQYALLLIDLDKFKQVNDTLGHNAGDELLIQISDRLKQACDINDLICRLGGDEFAILHRYIKEEADTGKFSKKILNIIYEPFTIADTKLTSSFSVGITHINEKYNTTVSILRDADIAMYQAKVNPENKIIEFEQSMQNASDKLFTLTQDIKNSILDNQLSLVYQPIIDIKNNKLIGAEALLRWHHPRYGDISPDLFISIAEGNGFINELFKYALSTACQLLDSNKNALLDYFFISLNVSGHQLKYGRLNEDLITLTKKYNLEPHRIHLELTETVLIDSNSKEFSCINKLVENKFSLLLDDFGTGYSSISSLYQLPFSFLKVDRSCIRDITTDIQCQRLFDGITSLANTVGINIIVEGVETTSQHTYLKNNGIQYAQGYIYAMPLSANKLVHLLNTKELIHIPHLET